MAPLGVVVGAPSLDLSAMMKHKDDTVAANVNGVAFLFKKNKIDWIVGAGRIAAKGKVVVRGEDGNDKTLEAKAIVIATGSDVARLSGTRGDGNAPLRSLSAALLLSVGLALAPVVARADSLALWRIVHDACEPHAEAGEGPKPCENVNLARGIAILKDLHGVVQMLAIPTRRITGIEDPQMLAPDAPNVFADAWKAKALLEERLGRPLPRESVALTINSKWARSQEQLHVHVDCLAKSVAEKLEDYRSALDDRWRAMTVALNGRMYFARRLELDGSFGRRTAQTARRRHRGRQRSYGRLFAGCGWRDFRRKARVHPARRQLFAGGPWPRRGPSGPRLRDHGFWAMN